MPMLIITYLLREEPLPDMVTRCFCAVLAAVVTGRWAD